ncbi:MAG: hypothetical protein HXY42_07345 [Chloroflexi bacterium]|nr:hypothetical protein [Chloroflexota bacterium]
MNAEATLARLRQILLLISAGVFGMTMTELIFLGHWNKTIQFLPFALCTLGLLACAGGYFLPGKVSLAGMRWSMVVIGLCSFIGIYEHMAGNYHFWREAQPGATVWALVKATLEGENPVLAPGILLLGTAIGLASLYRHPLLMPNHSKEKLK